ncbi:two-component system sensor histidine kinase YesM [Neobacillus niacini]|uniref:sensor histidine kinase n=1 Tax=Neobacillus niacini TaxID=86668 RepID=UPI002858F839|nr:histidine kinase [Neobacillus niacini]MDR7075626.1 two-component system sensor histidine kinase YesM [Neobacillus niacini]
MEILWKKVKQMSLRTRLIISVILCILFPWVGTYIVSNYFTKDVLEQRAATQSEDDLRMVELGIKNIFDDMMYTSNYIQFDTNMNQLLKSHKLIDANSPSVNQEVALNYSKISNELSGITDLLMPMYITILFNNDLFFTNYSQIDFNPLQFKEEPWFEKLDHLSFYQTYWLGAHPTYINSERNTYPHLITIGRKIQRANSFNSYLIISLKENEIKKLFSQIQSEKRAKFYLTNKSGEIYSSLNTDEVGTILPYDVTNADYQIVDYEDEKHLLVSYPVSYSNWRLVSLVPYNDTIGSINRVTGTTILIQGGFLVLFLLGLIMLVREFTKPIMRLNLVTKAIKQGDLSARIELSGSNDVAQLGHSFNHMLDTIEEMIEQIKIQEEAKRKAELDMLQAQINPHFLFNVLNAIRLKIKMEGDTGSASLIYSLSALLRMTINRNNAFIPLEEELTTVKHYVDLMNFRHRHDVELEIDVNEAASHFQVPRFFLQPVIENAIIHGHNNRKETIKIFANEQGNPFLEIIITDNGKGMDKLKLEQLKAKVFQANDSDYIKSNKSFNGIGVQNVYQRMKLIYGEAFQMRIDSIDGKGTTVTFQIPVHKE